MAILHRQEQRMKSGAYATTQTDNQAIKSASIEQMLALREAAVVLAQEIWYENEQKYENS